MKIFLYFVNKFLKRPFWLFIACSIVVGAHLILDGSFFRMLHLYNSQKVLKHRIKDIQLKNSLVEERLKKLKSDPRFLEQEVRERFNLVGEKDIIFIFPEEDESFLNKQGSINAIPAK